MISPLLGGIVGIDTGDRWLSVAGWIVAGAGGSEAIYHFSPFGTLKHLRVKLTTAPGAGESRTFEVFKGGTSTGITLTISGTATTGSDLVSTYAVVAGDNFFIKQTTSATPADSDVKWSLMFDGDTSKESPLFASSVQTLSTSLTQYLSCGGHLSGGSIPTNEDKVICVVPTNGTIKNMYVQLSGTPGGIATRTFTLRKNKSDTTLVVTLFSLEFSKSNTFHSVSVVAGDRISVKSTMTDSPDADRVLIGFTFVADTDGEFIILSSTENQLRTTGSRYASVSTGVRLVKLSITGVEQLAGDAMDIKKIYVHLSVAPGAGSNHAFKFFVADAESLLNCIVADTATACNSASTIAIAAGDKLASRVVPTGFPVESWAGISYLGFIAPPPSLGNPQLAMNSYRIRRNG